MTMPVIVINPSEIEIDVPMSRDEAIQLTEGIRDNLNKARVDVLKMYRSRGYKAMGYISFKEWAMQEFNKSYQQAYNLKTAAEIDEELSPLFSPTGDPLNIPVNHARQLRKIKTPEGRVRAYQLALTQAEAQGDDAPTEETIENTVVTVQSEEAVKSCPYPVVKQMHADDGLTAREARSIIMELDKLNDEPAQLYVQKLMAKQGLKNPQLIYPIGHKHKNERQRGKDSYVLDEIERTGRLAGVLLSEADTEDLKRANLEAQKQHIAEAEAAKKAKEEADYKQQMELHLEDPENNPAPKPKPEQVAITVWKHDSMKTLANLERELPEKDLDSLLLLLAKRRGWIVTEAELTGDPNKKLPETGNLLDVYPFARNGLECHQADTIEMIVRVKLE